MARRRTFGSLVLTGLVVALLSPANKFPQTVTFSDFYEITFNS